MELEDGAVASKAQSGSTVVCIQEVKSQSGTWSRTDRRNRVARAGAPSPGAELKSSASSTSCGAMARSGKDLRLRGS